MLHGIEERELQNVINQNAGFQNNIHVNRAAGVMRRNEIIEQLRN